MGLVAGIDSSTQSTKVVLRDLESGELVATATAPHPPTCPPVSEQDPTAWWDALVDCFRQLSEHAVSIRAISVGGQQHGLVLLKGSDVLRPAKLWNDLTSSPQSEQLISGAGSEWWARTCGSVPVPSFTITKLAWIQDHEPEIANAADRVMLPHDYLTWRLTGEHVTDRGDASGTGWFDPSHNAYRPELLEPVVDDPPSWISKLPRVAEHDRPVGPVTAQAATALGVRHDTLVGPGSGDNMAAAMGAGLTTSDVAISIGTSGTVYATSTSPTHDPTGLVAGFADATNNYLPLVCTVNAAKVTDAVANWLAATPGELSDLALSAIDQERGPVLVPYFDGERTPNLPDADGVWTGLQSTTTRAQLALSAFDGVICGLLEGMDILADNDVDVSGRTLLLGGGSQGRAYQQRLADLTNRQIVLPYEKQLVASGAAAQAAAILLGEPVREVAHHWGLGAGDVLDPDPHPSDAGTRQRYRQARDRVF